MFNFIVSLSVEDPFFYIRFKHMDHQPKKMRYLFNLLVSIDQLGNTICGGNPDCTISARIGYFASLKTGIYRYYWKFVESIVDFTFWPLQGPGHCFKAYQNDPGDVVNNNNVAFFRLIMTFFIMATCIPMSAFFYLIYPFRKLLKLER
jgi:hypothetical protein